jgi:hypothetical protein
MQHPQVNIREKVQMLLGDLLLFFGLLISNFTSFSAQIDDGYLNPVETCSCFNQFVKIYFVFDSFLVGFILIL